jgi:hypothetical protein
MVQVLDKGAKQALLARQPFVQLIHLEDGGKAEQVVVMVVVVVVEQDFVEVDGYDVAVE